MKIKTIEWDGRAITKPGLYSQVPLANYHAADICDGPSVSSSGLRKIFNESPAHFYSQWAGNPNRIDPGDKKAFVLGRAVHHLMLGEPFFAKLFCVRPTELPNYRTGEMRPWHGNNTECKEWLAARAKEGKAVLTEEQVAAIKGIAFELGKHPIVRAGALNGMIERSIFWKDKETGIWIKSRPDSIPGDSGDFVDLKTCQSVKWLDLMRSIADYGYAQQGGLVRAAAREVLKIPSPTFTLVFVEVTPPHCPRIVTLKDSELDRGERANRMALDAMAACLRSGNWPGPGGGREDAEPIELPEWSQRQIDDRLKYGLPT